MRAALREDTLDERATNRMPAVDVLDAEASGAMPTATERMLALDADEESRTIDDFSDTLAELGSADDTFHDVELDTFAALRDEVPATLWARLGALI
jgi:hypothetical protein